MRGLKHLDTRQRSSTRGRTFTGAWIETQLIAVARETSRGRTFTGAWIETDIVSGDSAPRDVAPLQVRGLKQDTPSVGRGS